MACLVDYVSRNVYCTTEVSSIIRGRHVYMCEAKDYDKFAIGVWDLLVGHVPIEISSLCYHFLNSNEQNTLTAVATGKRNGEVSLIVPAKLFFQTKDRKSVEILWNENIQKITVLSSKVLRISTKRKYKIDLVFWINAPLVLAFFGGKRLFEGTFIEFLGVIYLGGVY